MSPIFLRPITKTLIWGTEQWGISAHSNGDDEICGGEFDGKTLSWLWRERPALFGMDAASQAAFPLLTKIIDAKSDLSIQVHPDDDYAARNENGSYGKTECWYIMDAAPGATIVIGHNAKNSGEVREMIEGRRWSDFIREIPVHGGDFFFIEPGTVHAIKGGTVILETQQSSDITYRVYDYDRLQDGKPRPLHVKQSIDVIKAPFEQKDPPLDGKKTLGDSSGTAVRQLVSCPLFTVWHASVSGTLEVQQTRPFLLCSVIRGSCTLDGVPSALEVGTHLILPAGFGSARFAGNAELIFSSI